MRALDRKLLRDLRNHRAQVLSIAAVVACGVMTVIAMRSTLGADRSREHMEAHSRAETVTHVHLRAEQVVDWATRGGARALGRDDLGVQVGPMLAFVVGHVRRIVR